MKAEKKSRDPRVQVWSNSPAMLAGWSTTPKDENKIDLVLCLSDLQPGESVIIPLDLAHEPSLRVRVSRQNGKELSAGSRKHYRLLKHGAPHWCYEIGCIGGSVGNPVSRETPNIYHHVPPVEEP